MSSIEERNKAIIAKYFSEYWAKQNPDVVDEVCADDVIQFYPMHANPKRGRATLKRNIVEFKAAFPDITFETYGPYPLIAEGDYVFGRWIGRGTHTGIPFDDTSVGALSEPNTGKQICFSGMTIFTLKDGKIVKEIGEEGGVTVLQQLGLMESPKKGRQMFYDIENM